MMRTSINLEQGMLEFNNDYSGYTKVTSSEEKSRFFVNRVGDKIYYTSMSDEYVAGRPFEIKIGLSKMTQKF